VLFHGNFVLIGPVFWRGIYFNDPAHPVSSCLELALGLTGHAVSAGVLAVTLYSGLSTGLTGRVTTLSCSRPRCFIANAWRADRVVGSLVDLQMSPQEISAGESNVTRGADMLATGKRVIAHMAGQGAAQPIRFVAYRTGIHS
jgi:hypothetical protein